MCPPKIEEEILEVKCFMHLWAFMIRTEGEISVQMSWVLFSDGLHKGKEGERSGNARQIPTIWSPCSPWPIQIPTSCHCVVTLAYLDTNQGEQGCSWLVSKQVKFTTVAAGHCGDLGLFRYQPVATLFTLAYLDTNQLQPCSPWHI